MEKKEGKKGLRPKLYSYIHDNDKKRSKYYGYNNILQKEELSLKIT